MQDKIYNLLLDKDEITWQSILYDLIRSGQMDPWDIDISFLTNRYLETLKTLKEANFLISGKVVLAAAILLKIKSDRLVNEKIALFDQRLFYDEENEIVSEELKKELTKIQLDVDPKLVVKTPLSRKKRVTINDLVGALQKALEVDQRRTLRRLREQEHIRKVKIPEKKIDLTSLVKSLYDKILSFFQEKETITFTELTPGERREDKIMTFIPMLHLVNQGKIDIDQEKHFGEIFIRKL